MSFVEVASLKNIPSGKSLLVEVNGKAIALHHVNGKVYATEELCPHRAGPLSEGDLVGEEIVCPWHGARFRVTDGSIVKGPATRPIACFATKIEGDKVLISVE